MPPACSDPGHTGCCCRARASLPASSGGGQQQAGGRQAVASSRQAAGRRRQPVGVPIVWMACQFEAFANAGHAWRAIAALQKLTGVQQVPQVGQRAGQPQLLSLPQCLHPDEFGSVRRRASAEFLCSCRPTWLAWPVGWLVHGCFRLHRRDRVVKVRFRPCRGAQPAAAANQK